MAKTNFANGTIVTPDWFNRMQNIVFDDQNLDGHYPRLTDDALSSQPGNIKARFSQYIQHGFADRRGGLTVEIKEGIVVLANGRQVDFSGVYTAPPNTEGFIYVNNQGSLIFGNSIPADAVALARYKADATSIVDYSDLRPNVNLTIPKAPIDPNAAIPVGTVITHMGVSTPSGWLPMVGQSLIRSEYGRLADALGVPNNATHFSLPNMADKFPIGASSGLPVGSTVGSNHKTLSVANLPNHNHGGTVSMAGSHDHGAYSAMAGEHGHALLGKTTDDTDGVQGTDRLDSSHAAVAGENNSNTGGSEAYTYTNGSNQTLVSIEGQHQHQVLMDMAGQHVHTIPSQGSNEPINVVPASVAFNYLIKY